MVLNVDDWVETEDGDIGLVVEVEARSIGNVLLYTPGEDKPHVVKVEDITGSFPTLLHKPLEAG